MERWQPRGGASATRRSLTASAGPTRARWTGERDAAGERAREELVGARRAIDEIGVEQGQSGDLYQGTVHLWTDRCDCV